MPPCTWMQSCVHRWAAAGASVAATAAANSTPVAAMSHRFERIVDRAGSVPHRRGGAFGVGDHLGALVLDGLELADRPAELLPDLRVLRRRVGRPARHADRPRRTAAWTSARVRGRHAQVAQHGVVADLDGVGPHMRDGPQRVQALAPARSRAGRRAAPPTRRHCRSPPGAPAPTPAPRRERRGLRRGSPALRHRGPAGSRSARNPARRRRWRAGGQARRAPWPPGRARRSARWRSPTARTARARRRSRTRPARWPARGGRNPVRRRTRPDERPAGPVRRPPASTAAGFSIGVSMASCSTSDGATRATRDRTESARS